MARPVKQGIDYYPMDVGFISDMKVRRIMRNCGASAIAVIISLLGYIYRDNGYYLKWDSDMAFVIAEEVCLTESAVMAIISQALRAEFFSACMWEEHQVLTSVGIQERFFSAIQKRKRVTVVSDYLLVNVESINAANNLVFDVKNPVSDVNNSKLGKNPS